MRVKLHGVRTYLPTPEDLILLKIIPGRDTDTLDIKAVIERHKTKLDTGYLENWAQALSDEAQDLRIWNILKKLLR